MESFDDGSPSSNNWAKEAKTGMSRRRPLSQINLVPSPARNTIYFRVNAKSPFISLLKRAKKEVEKLNGKKYNAVELLGVSQSIEKTLSLGLRFQSLGYEIRVETETVEIYDDNFELRDSRLEWSMEARRVSMVKIRVTNKSYEEKV